MPSAAEDARRATIPLARGPHPRNDDEDMHPARLDPAEAELEKALQDMQRAKQKRR